MAWILCIIGTLYSFYGAFIFYKRVYEKDKKLWPSILMMIMGIILIVAGTAIYFHVWP